MSETNAAMACPAGKPRRLSTDVAVELVAMNKWYGDFHVLRDINLKVMGGERIVICGPSGSGKSTMIRCINRLEEHQAGRVVIDGIELTNDLKKIDEVRREVGMVFQHFNLFPHLTVLENLTLAPIWVRKTPKKQAEEIAMHFLKRVKIPEQANKYPGQLSGGQQQRVALARALVFDPKLVLMDEPLGALDKQLREQMQLEIKHIHKNVGVTVVYVTHDQSEALTMSDRIAVFNDGTIQQLATPEDLYERPENAFVAQFIGENNRLRGKVTAMNGTTCQVAIEGGAGVKALAVNVDAVGQPTTLSLRPERVKINPSAGSMPNLFSAEVRELIYLGDHVRTRVAVCGHEDFVIKLPNTEGGVQFEPGEKITIGWKAEDCRALDAA